MEIGGDEYLSFFRLDPFLKNDTLMFFLMTIEIKLRKGEPMDRAIRRLKKRLDREGVIRDVRAKRYFEKPSDKKRIARKVAAFSQMLRTRYEKM
ncbi:30S ribosomal protein S21 [Opitutales bacterium]|jgi:small subunit ribosomal protein S21|nr:30S ribosomal protein S21 [Opitutales bacterium]MDA8991369.1 30S ribosomal protein S21 [Opitutales bacterium]